MPLSLANRIADEGDHRLTANRNQTITCYAISGNCKSQREHVKRDQDVQVAAILHAAGLGELCRNDCTQQFQ